MPTGSHHWFDKLDTLSETQLRTALQFRAYSEMELLTQTICPGQPALLSAQHKEFTQMLLSEQPPYKQAWLSRKADYPPIRARMHSGRLRRM